MAITITETKNVTLNNTWTLISNSNTHGEYVQFQGRFVLNANGSITISFRFYKPATPNYNGSYGIDRVQILDSNQSTTIYGPSSIQVGYTTTENTVSCGNVTVTSLNTKTVYVHATYHFANQVPYDNYTQLNISFNTTQLSHIKVYDGSAWRNAIPYIYNGSSWQQAIPYLYNDSSWQICGG